MGPLLRCLWAPFTVVRIGGVPIQFHGTGVIVPWVLAARTSPIYPAGEVLLVSSLYFTLFYLSILIHEMAHVLVARACGIHTSRVIILPIGGLALLKAIPRGITEFWIAAAGPFASLVAAGALWLVAQSVDVSSSFWMRRIGGVFLLGSQLNLMLALLNLLPCHPLDGGRMLRAALVLFYRHKHGATPDQARLLATRVAVRYVAWLILAGVILSAVRNPVFWPDVALLSFVLLLGEGEYWLLRTEPGFDVEDPAG